MPSHCWLWRICFSPVSLKTWVASSLPTTSPLRQTFWECEWGLVVSSRHSFKSTKWCFGEIQKTLLFTSELTCTGNRQCYEKVGFDCRLWNGTLDSVHLLKQYFTFLLHSRDKLSLLFYAFLHKPSSSVLWQSKVSYSFRVLLDLMKKSVILYKERH